MKERAHEQYEIEDSHREISTGHSPNLESETLNQVFIMFCFSRNRSRDIKFNCRN
jgi:hypothetical protein